MSKFSKRIKKCLEAVDKNKLYSLEEAVAILKNVPQPKFDQTVEIACNLNIDPKQSEQTVRGSVILPHGIGKTVRVIVFCKGDDIDKAKSAGADFAGGSDLIEKIKKGWLEFDTSASTPEMMKDVAQLGKVLGPRGMMPAPKAGTVGPDIERIVKDLKGGKVQFKADKTANIHAIVGKISFSDEKICENTLNLFKAITQARPSVVKGRFVKNMTLTTTMGPGVRLDLGRLGQK
ncbi:MAG: 50S ribosomal protein L1 [Candidatus Omnitrophica bacterium]|nr:50S ribosomal protein L1 [Candidatus Omnitrophota bacterium]